MRTPQTATIFARDLQRVDDMNAGWWTPDRIERIRTAELIRHAEYDRWFDQMITQVQAVKDRCRPFVHELLMRLDTPGCLSGSMDYVGALNVLHGLGVTHANWVFGHDRVFVAREYLAKKETA